MANPRIGERHVAEVNCFLADAVRGRNQTHSIAMSASVDSERALASALRKVDRRPGSLFVKIIPGSFLDAGSVPNSVVAYQRWEHAGFRLDWRNRHSYEFMASLHLSISREFETLTLMHLVSPGTVVEPKLAIYDTLGNMHGYAMESLDSFSMLGLDMRSRDPSGTRRYLRMLADTVWKFHSVLDMPHGDIDHTNIFVRNGSMKLIDPLPPTTQMEKRAMFIQDAKQLSEMFAYFKASPSESLLQVQSRAYANMGSA